MNAESFLGDQMWDLARRLRGASHRRTAYGLVVTSEVPLGVGNFLFVTPGKEADRFGREAWEQRILGFFGDSRTIPWQLRLPSDIAAPVRTALSLNRVSEETQMVLDLGGQPVPRPTFTNGHLKDIFTVDSESHLYQFHTVMSKVFDLKGWAVRLAFPEVPGMDSYTVGATTRFFVANPNSASESTAIGTAAVTIFPQDGVAVLSNIGVRTLVRHQGWGTALTVAAMRYAEKNGVKRFVLLATEAGKPVYTAMGFRPGPKFTTLENRPGLFDRARNSATARRMAGEVE